MKVEATPRLVRMKQLAGHAQPFIQDIWRVDFNPETVVWTEHEDIARLIAAAPALRDSLEELLYAVLEMDPPSQEIKTRAMQVVLASKGL